MDWFRNWYSLSVGYVSGDKRVCVHGSGLESVLSGRLNHLDEKSAFRPCGRDLVEFFQEHGMGVSRQVAAEQPPTERAHYPPTRNIDRW